MPNIGDRINFYRLGVHGSAVLMTAESSLRFPSESLRGQDSRDLALLGTPEIHRSRDGARVWDLVPSADTENGFAALFPIPVLMSAPTGEGGVQLLRLSEVAADFRVLDGRPTVRAISVAEATREVVSIRTG